MGQAMEKTLQSEIYRESIWHTMSADEAIDRLTTHRMQGLSEEVAQQRLREIGYNELKEAPRPTFWHRLWAQLKEFLVVLLIVASFISLILGDYIEAVAIMSIVILNTILGVVQESRAEEALAALKKMTAPEALVIRDGSQTTIPSRELVPGDLVVLETGNFVPADIRLIEAINLQITEASLTGESAPVQKRADTLLDREIPLGDRKNTAYMSTVVTYGRGRGVVVSTGMNTQIGLIAQLVQSFHDEPTPLQRKLDQLGRTLGIAALAICGAVFVIGIIRFLLNPVVGVTLSEAILSMFMVAVSLAIAAVPEGLPAVVTICLALGMQRMIKRHALLRQLSAVEALGSTTVICSDKTGTLTQNEMTVVKIWSDGKLLEVTGLGYVPEGEFIEEGHHVKPTQNPVTDIFLKTLLLCNDAFIETSGTSVDRLTWRMVGDPTEGALIVLAAKAGLWKYEVEHDLPRLAEIPFDSDRKIMTTIHMNKNLNGLGKWFGQSQYLAMVKGAPDLVLKKCKYLLKNGTVQPLCKEDAEEILKLNSTLASQALRVLSGAIKPMDGIPGEEDLKPHIVENELVFTGLVGMIDPPRLEVQPAIQVARKAGIKTVMITGDYPNTAVAIADQIGLLKKGGQVIVGREMDQIDDQQFHQIVNDVDVYARVSPQHKVKIVEALQSRNHIVSMTGDGVNDAPALKKANIGVAMGITGTDVSKEASAMVLTDDNYASIVSAVEEGRIIYSNIRKFVFYLLSCNVGEILIIFLATLSGLPLPLTPIQLLVLNLITDGAPALALGLEKGDPDIMEQPPRKPEEPVINQTMVTGIVVQSIAITVAVLGAFLIALNLYPENQVHAQTMAFTTLSISELLRAYTSRSERYSVFKIRIFSNRYMQYAVFSSLIILIAIIYVPFLAPIFEITFLTIRDWLIILPLILLPSVAAELTKWFQRR
jgi:P-type Ca2+ transporter type 2C